MSVPIDDRALVLARRALGERRIEELHRLALTHLSEALGGERLSLLAHDEEIRGYRFVAGHGIPDAVLKAGRVTVEDNVLARVIERREAVHCADLSVEAGFGRPKRLRYRSGSFVVAPFDGEKRPAGFLCVTEPRNGRVYGPADAAWLSSYARVFGEAFRAVNERADLRHRTAFEIEDQRARDLQGRLGPTSLKLPFFEAAQASRPGAKGATLFVAWGRRSKDGLFFSWVEASRPQRLDATAVAEGFASLRALLPTSKDGAAVFKASLPLLKRGLAAKDLAGSGYLEIDAKRKVRLAGRPSSQLWRYERKTNRLTPLAEGPLLPGDWVIAPPSPAGGEKGRLSAALKRELEEFVLARRDGRVEDLVRELIASWRRDRSDRDAFAWAGRVSKG